ncbi:CoA-acylating methylmalonate-semialdehyde dehydrogenase [Parapedobacter indicus]|uniref:methylmalonate-semialdehyde dehydrogenase (CoA acylating) n=1 Tax=Parapedobacter indicus TaxID=1477437 RepID=A0A1I3G0N5_9SPHI|nr:CoA-acylating methylmalonate-semialdehyde dehydrogenase [Parapedobacter indicus]PPL03976.1 methylmalonate-semialdehyde dehydrogenase [acylating] [Parapedobacter indicus]SFI17030.1 methylmalonate-semialdehyde dehydrogenase [acylating] [Parapedobacter indicus]
MEKATDFIGRFSHVPLLIGNQWTGSRGNDTTPVYNPSKGQVIAHTPSGIAEDVDRAVKAANDAFPSWAAVPAPKRADILFHYRELLAEHLEHIAWLIATENGKTIEEARGDIRRGFEVVEFACGIAHLTKGENLGQLAAEIDGLTMREPLGVCVGISPFNFPAMVAMWMFPLAIACGNTFVLKPSEKVPLTALYLADLLVQAGLPAGVFNVVHGGREVVEALCVHPDVAAISFVGSSEIALRVYQLGTSRGKRVQAGGGAKNVHVVMPDADFDSAVRAVVGAAFGCSGQRCMAGSTLMIPNGTDAAFLQQLNAAVDQLVVGDTTGQVDVQMGPVIDGLARDRISDTIQHAVSQGAKPMRDGRRFQDTDGFFLRPTLLDEVSPDMEVFRREVFGPVLSIVHTSTLDESIRLANTLPFGNGATIYTSNGGAARKFAREMKCGMIGVNVGVPAPMAIFPFSGWNQSFYGDLHLQGTEGILFYTRQKVLLSRWDTNYERINGW